MKLYDFGQAPNPRRVRIFLAEKGLKVPTEQLNIHLAAPHRGLCGDQPDAAASALALDDGTAIAESIAICRYFEALHPDPPLFGCGSLDCALVEMWNRRVAFHLFFPVAIVFQHLHPAMKAIGRPAGAGMGRGQQAVQLRVSAIPRWRAEEPPLCHGRAIHGGRYHCTGGGGLYEGVEACCARRTCQPAALARGGFGPPERCGVAQLLSW